VARRHVALVVRTEVRRRLRAVDDPRKGLAYAFSGLFGLAFGLAVVVGAFFVGRAIAGGDFPAPLSTASAAVSGLLAIVAFMTGLRAVQGSAVPTHLGALLVAMRHRDVVTALLAVEGLVPLGLVGVPGLCGAVTFAAGAGSVASAILIAVTVLCLVALGTLTGFALGLVVRNAIARSRLLARYKGAVGVLVVFAYFGVLYGTDAGDVLAPVVRVLGATPLRWFADLALLAVVPAASPVRAVAALGAAGLAMVALWVATTRLASWLWYSTPVEPYGDVRESSIGRLPLVGRATDRIVRKTWTRARRAPIRLVYVVYPLVAAVGPLLSSFDGGVPALAAPMVVVYGAWTTGAAFTLNPIGDETPVLPVTLTTPVTGRRFVRALWLAGGAIGVPLTLVLAVGTGVAAGFEPAELLLVAILGVGLPALAPGLATGVGAAFPRVQPAQVTRSRQAVVPSLFAFGGYSIALLVCASPSWLALSDSARRAVANLVGVSPTTVGAVGAVAALGLVGVGSVASYRYGARTFDRYTVS